jgi:anti-sigma factor RsiW
MNGRYEEQMMRHEDAYGLMMAAVDGELDNAGRRSLEAHLASCQPCAREWQALVAIEALFRHAPALSPAAGFTTRTLARLPESRYRIWLISGVYGLLLLSGIIPLAALVWIGLLLAPAIRQPALLRTLVQSAEQVLPAIGAVLSALWRGIAGAGAIVGENPAIVGWLLVMAGLVWVWATVYDQLVLQPARSRTI